MGVVKAALAAGAAGTTAPSTPSSPTAQAAAAGGVAAGGAAGRACLSVALCCKNKHTHARVAWGGASQTVCCTTNMRMRSTDKCKGQVHTKLLSLCTAASLKRLKTLLNAYCPRKFLFHAKCTPFSDVIISLSKRKPAEYRVWKIIWPDIRWMNLVGVTKNKVFHRKVETAGGGWRLSLFLSALQQHFSHPSQKHWIWSMQTGGEAAVWKLCSKKSEVWKCVASQPPPSTPHTTHVSPLTAGSFCSTSDVRSEQTSQFNTTIYAFCGFKLLLIFTLHISMWNVFWLPIFQKYRTTPETNTKCFQSQTLGSLKCEVVCHVYRRIPLGRCHARVGTWLLSLSCCSFPAGRRSPRSRSWSWSISLAPSSGWTVVCWWERCSCSHIEESPAA